MRYDLTWLLLDFYRYAFIGNDFEEHKQYGPFTQRYDIKRYEVRE